MLIKVRVMTGTGRMSMWFDAYAESLWVLVTGSVSCAALVAGSAFHRLRRLSNMAVLETNGSISVMPKSRLANGAALEGVQDAPGSENP